jgi:hypothetical protein
VWLVNQPIGPLRVVFHDLGLTDASFDACLDDERLIDGVSSVRELAYNEFQG